MVFPFIYCFKVSGNPDWSQTPFIVSEDDLELLILLPPSQVLALQVSASMLSPVL